MVGNSYLVTGLTPGRTYYFTVRARSGSVSSAPSNEVSAVPYSPYTPIGQLVGPVVSIASSADGNGYWLATGSGALSAHGSAVDAGSTAGEVLAAPIVKIVGDPRGGYWEVASDGGVFAFGGAPYKGAAASERLNSPIVDLVPTADGNGYWEVAADGGVFAYGDAAFAGSLGGTAQSRPIIGLAPDRVTGGYWLVSASGAVTGFHAPPVVPQAGNLPNSPVVAVAGTADGRGFWEVTAAGSVYAVGDAGYLAPDAPFDPLHADHVGDRGPGAGRRLLDGLGRRWRLRRRQPLPRRRLTAAPPTGPGHRLVTGGRTPTPTPPVDGPGPRRH